MGMDGALVFGVLIAATDPVSVIATFKEAGVKGRLRILVEAESLFNEGVAAVLFGVAIAVAPGQEITPAYISLALIQTVGGGIACGALIANHISGPHLKLSFGVFVLLIGAYIVGSSLMDNTRG
jgi:NhaP-type Na+/H+ or K+/H+ antiporter